MSDRNANGPVLALSGGVGGAKLALGLYRILPPDTLTIVANTGDDFAHLGLSISPDLDTLLYTLSGNDNPELGWGRRGETWTFMTALEALGGESWFRLGDGDLATHVERTRRLKAGESLSTISDDFRRRLGIAACLLPMSDNPVRTKRAVARAPSGSLRSPPPPQGGGGAIPPIRGRRGVSKTVPGDAVAHRKRSCSGGRTIAAAGASGAVQERPRTTTIVRCSHCRAASAAPSSRSASTASCRPIR